jgi:membrane protease YdiL (CAAX protease family)
MDLVWGVIYLITFGLLVGLFYLKIGRFPVPLSRSKNPKRDILLVLVLWGIAAVVSALKTTWITPSLNQMFPDKTLHELMMVPVAAVFYIGIPYILVIKPGHWSIKDLGLTFRVQSIGVSILAIILGIVTGSVAFINNQAVFGIDPLPWGVLFILLFTNSFVEEFYHRGVIQSFLERAVGQKSSVFIGGALFGLTHVVFDIVNLLGSGGILAVISALLLQTMGGWLVGIIYLKTRSIFPGLAFHYLINWLPSILLNIMK